MSTLSHKTSLQREADIKLFLLKTEAKEQASSNTVKQQVLIFNKWYGGRTSITLIIISCGWIDPNVINIDTNVGTDVDQY